MGRCTPRVQFVDLNNLYEYVCIYHMSIYLRTYIYVATFGALDGTHTISLLSSLVL